MSFSKGSNHFAHIVKKANSFFFFQKKEMHLLSKYQQTGGRGLNPTITTTTSLDLFAPRRSVISV